MLLLVHGTNILESSKKAGRNVETRNTLRAGVKCVFMTSARNPVKAIP